MKNATDGPITTPLADVPSDGFSLGIRTNINGTFYGMKHEIPAMHVSDGGVITNMASGAGIGAVSNLSAYVSGTAEIIGLSRSAPLDYAVQGIRIEVMARPYPDRSPTAPPASAPSRWRRRTCRLDGSG